jgi:hypothetical protein
MLGCIMAFSSFQATLFCFLFCTVYGPCFGISESQVHEKDEIGQWENSSKKSLMTACRFEREQDHHQALKKFIEAIDQCPTQDRIFPTDPDEKKQVEEGISLYLESIDQNPSHVIKEFRNRYEELAEKHPDWDYLQFFLAIADANDFKFAGFYRRFYQAYQHYPNSFLALRTRGVLHLKLYEQLLGEEREKERKLAIFYLKKAADLDFREAGLIRLILFTSSRAERKTLLQTMIPKLMKEQIRLPRKDITLYVRWLLQENLIDLAQDFILNAQTWYEYSRSIKLAENLLEQVKKRTR